MKKILLASASALALLGAGCTTNTSLNATADGTTSSPTANNSVDYDAVANDGEQDMGVGAHVIGNAAFTLVLPDGVTYQDNENGGRWQNFVGSDDPAPLSEGEYFVEFVVETTGDLEFNDETESIVSLAIDGQVVDKGDMKDEYSGGDTTKYIVNYFRAGDGEDRVPVLIRVYADTESGLAAGETSLENIEWQN